MAIHNAVLRMFRSTSAHRVEAVPPPQPPRMIVGGDAANELCMLPLDCNLFGDHRGWGHKRVTQIKIDGVGAKYIDGRIVTKEGVPLDCALHCQPGLRRLQEAFGEEMFFDGEYVEDDGFNATVAAMQRRRGAGVFWIYDAVPLYLWRGGACSRPIEMRLGMLEERINRAESEFVGMLGFDLLDSEQTKARCAELWALGYEGVVSKEAGSPYIRDRSDKWLRIKQVITEDLPVMDVICAGGILRKIMVRGPTGPITVATGWKGGHGAEIVRAFAQWKEGDAPLLAEVSYQLSTGVKRSTRGARFHRLRLDRTGAKA